MVLSCVLEVFLVGSCEVVVAGSVGTCDEEEVVVLFGVEDGVNRDGRGCADGSGW